MLQMPMQFDNSYGVPRETLSRVARYIVQHLKRDSVLTVWFEEEFAEFEMVEGQRLVVRFEDMGV